MTFTEARRILELHNLWRRDSHEPNKYDMVNPTELGTAIDTAIEALNFCVETGCESYSDMEELCYDLRYES